MELSSHNCNKFCMINGGGKCAFRRGDDNYLCGNCGAWCAPGPEMCSWQCACTHANSTCEFPGCSKAKYSGPGAKACGFAHKCNYEGCGNVKYPGSEACGRRHKCEYQGCGKAKHRGSKACSLEHKCPTRGCGEAKGKCTIH